MEEIYLALFAARVMLVHDNHLLVKFMNDSKEPAIP